MKKIYVLIGGGTSLVYENQSIEQIKKEVSSRCMECATKIISAKPYEKCCGADIISVYASGKWLDL
jgi:tRNA G37 N-methylase Trm5